LKNHTEQLTNSLGQETSTEVKERWPHFYTRNIICYHIQYIRITVIMRLAENINYYKTTSLGGTIPSTTSTRTGSMLYLSDITP